MNHASSWPLHIPFPTAHPLWAGNLPTKASEISEIFRAYDAVFALGGKSLITILYTEGPAVPAGCDLFHMSADVRNLGRTYATKLGVVGDIKASLGALLLLLAPRLADRAEAYAALCDAARREQKARRARLTEAADAVFDAPLISPLVAAREMARAIGPEIAIVDEAVATSLHLRNFLNSRRRGSIHFHAAEHSAGVCLRRSASRSGSIARPSSRSSAMVPRSTHRRHSGQPHTRSCQ